MEELKTAVSAMKQAEEALARQGFTLKWNIRIKTNRRFLRNTAERILADAMKAEPLSCKKAAVKKAQPETESPADADQSEQVPERSQGADQATEQSQSNEAEDAQAPISSLDITSAAEYLGITVPGVYDLIKRGRIPAHGKLGKRWFLPEELDKYREEREKRKADKS